MVRIGADLGTMPDPPDPFWLILGFIAVLTVVLFPVRLWRRRRHRYDDGSEEDDSAV